MANMLARKAKEKVEGRRVGPVTIAFETWRDREEFAAVLEGTEAPGPKVRNAFEDFLSGA